ncbi:hypothetical protein GGGNBK_04835 [Sporosarcina sp. ANT_H38]
MIEPKPLIDLTGALVEQPAAFIYRAVFLE